MLTNTKKMLLDAQTNGYAVPAFNIHNLETVQAVTEAAEALRSPVILAATPGTFSYAGRDYIQAIAETAAARCSIPVALHLDHHEEIDDIRESLSLGTKSVMIDASHHPFAENTAIVASIVQYARQKDATVEAELGRLGGQEDDLIVDEADAYYTDPDAAKEFVEKPESIRLRWQSVQPTGFTQKNPISILTGWPRFKNGFQFRLSCTAPQEFRKKM